MATYNWDNSSEPRRARAWDGDGFEIKQPICVLDTETGEALVIATDDKGKCQIADNGEEVRRKTVTYKPPVSLLFADGERVGNFSRHRK